MTNTSNQAVICDDSNAADDCYIARVVAQLIEERRLWTRLNRTTK
jgi:hypothetical protein